jgi:hypothetical protein
MTTTLFSNLFIYCEFDGYLLLETDGRGIC